jgi:hypothetical protein
MKALIFALSSLLTSTPLWAQQPADAVPATIVKVPAGIFILQTDFSLQMKDQTDSPYSVTKQIFADLYLREKDRNKTSALAKEKKEIFKDYAKEQERLRSSFFKQDLSQAQYKDGLQKNWNSLKDRYSQFDGSHPHCQLLPDSTMAATESTARYPKGMRFYVMGMEPSLSADLLPLSKKEFDISVKTPQVQTKENDPNQSTLAASGDVLGNLRLSCTATMSIQDIEKILVQSLMLKGQLKEIEQKPCPPQPPGTDFVKGCAFDYGDEPGL